MAEESAAWGVVAEGIGSGGGGDGKGGEENARVADFGDDIFGLADEYVGVGGDEVISGLDSLPSYNRTEPTHASDLGLSFYHEVVANVSAATSSSLSSSVSTPFSSSFTPASSSLESTPWKFKGNSLLYVPFTLLLISVILFTITG